jgi:hypothetical protein
MAQILSVHLKQACVHGTGPRLVNWNSTNHGMLEVRSAEEQARLNKALAWRPKNSMAGPGNNPVQVFAT